LEKKCREEHVDGVTTGYSESPVECCIELCARLGLPCYCTEDQLLFTRDKLRFKAVCRKNGVPVVKEYASVEDVDEFPVIVKPVDRAGSIGISIAENKEELLAAYDFAMEKSFCNEVIIEEYIENGTKVDMYYSILEGEITLLSTGSSFLSDKNGHERVVQIGWYLPSHVHNLLVKEIDPAMKEMIKDLGIKNGYIFISGFERNKEFVFFEAGFRLSGGHLYNYFEALGQANLLDIFIYHALTGSTKDVPRNVNGNNALKCMTVNIYANDGTISCIEGMKEIELFDDCYCALTPGRVGKKCEKNGAILPKIAMYYFCSTDPQKLEEDTKKAYELLRIEDEQGNDMIYDRIETLDISRLWGK